MKVNQTFRIVYWAKKYKKHITRYGKWDKKCKQWTSKKGVKCTTYFDIHANNYRTATNGEIKNG